MLNALVAYPVLSYGIFKLLMARDVMGATIVKKYNSRRRNSRAAEAKDEVVVDEKDEEQQQ